MNKIISLGKIGCASAMLKANNVVPDETLDPHCWHV